MTGKIVNLHKQTSLINLKITYEFCQRNHIIAAVFFFSVIDGLHLLTSFIESFFYLNALLFQMLLA